MKYGKSTATINKDIFDLKYLGNVLLEKRGNK